MLKFEKTCSREHGLRVGQYDWEYSQRGMNFLSNGGFAWGSQNMSHHSKSSQLLSLYILASIDISYIRTSHVLALRTAIYLVLCLMPFGMLLFGPDCSSWTLISRGTSWRSILNPWGDLSSSWVRNANCMISRNLNSY